MSAITLVFEVSNDANDHFSYRVDYSKYEKYFNDVAGAITAEVPNAVCLINRIPKEWARFDQYCNLIPDEDDNNPYYNMVPR